MAENQVPEPSQPSVTCKYIRIGCQWKGSTNEAREHERVCAYPKMSGAELMIALQEREMDLKEKKKLCISLIDLLNNNYAIYFDLELVDSKERLKTKKFTAFNHQWQIKARIINNCHTDQDQSCDCEIVYKLILKTSTPCPIKIIYVALKGSKTKHNATILRHDFTDTENESEYNMLPIPDNYHCNRLDSEVIKFRLFMAPLFE